MHCRPHNMFHFLCHVIDLYCRKSLKTKNMVIRMTPEINVVFIDFKGIKGNEMVTENIQDSKK